VGQGAFGKVFCGEWGKTKVALKKIDNSLDELNKEDQIIMEALQWEVSRLSTVSHPNCVKFYGIYQHEYTYMVTEFCDQGTLFDILERLEDENWLKRWQWSLEMTQGLFYLHQKGIIHRDLKAENVLIDQYGCAKLSATVVSMGLNDKRFIAPENLKDPTKSNPSTDIYALGLVFWQMSTGKIVPRNPSDMSEEELENWFKGKMIEREMIPSKCPDTFKSLILSCWMNEPLKRPTAEDILKELILMGTQYHPQPILFQAALLSLFLVMEP